jgi:hypothetical protein
MMGMKSFYVNGQNFFSFESSLGETTSVSSTSGYQTLMFMYWSFRLRVCPTGYPYFELPTLLCYDVCPDGTYPNDTILTCPACNYTCRTCSSFNVCTDCNITTNRYLNGTACPPNPGFFDNNTAIAVPCTVGSINCTNLSICLNCNSGFYLKAGICIDCHNTYSNCNLCTQTICT